MNETPMITLKVAKAVQENPHVKTIYFDYPMEAKPGQCVMLWIPGAGEKPMSISYCDGKRFGVSVYAIGSFSNAAMNMKAGCVAGFRGPFGTSFTLGKEKSLALVGGGCGCAPLAFLAEEALKRKKKVFFLQGARSRDYLFSTGRMKKAGAKVLVSTDDGSAGAKGFVTGLLRSLLQKERIGKICACGPEIMMKKAVEISDEFKTPCEISLERYMKCGMGICGQCAVDPLGIRMCVEGPVIKKETVKKITEFGKHRRDASGRRVPI
ncbi:MAG: dihydroorotate dehydrogenase electron transfer subunit [Candidatus ainarchaeum sp.]|nr:dihydroorotate dehydrogenase electron transfer subunit [Candidatus ainarchaeum sp.]